jgi:Tol biopolymer transport system component
LTWLDRAGRQVRTIGTPGLYLGFRLSPDYQKIAVAKQNRRTGTPEIWLIDKLNGSEFPLTTTRTDSFLVWAPDGKQPVFASDQGGGIFDLYRRPLDRSQSEQLVYKSSKDKEPTSWSGDGRSLLFDDKDAKTGHGVWLLSLEDSTAKPLILTSSYEGSAAFSPNGRWVAYASDESGRRQINVQSFPQGDIRAAISRDGGSFPVWSPKGDELFFLSDDREIMAAELHTDTTDLQAKVPKRLFPIPGPTRTAAKAFSVSEDGQQFLLNLPTPDSGTQMITVVLNWATSLQKR